jgi:branched-chain amino acid transport system permease protein
MVYHLQLGAAIGAPLRYLGLSLAVGNPLHWLAALAVTAIGFALFEYIRRLFAREWGAIQSEIESDMVFKEPHAPVPEGGEAAAREARLGAP